MFVSVIGSWRSEDAEKSKLVDGEGFRNACHALGAGIVKRGHTLLAATDRPETADFHAVEGAIAALQHEPVPRVRIILFGQRSNFGNWLQKFPKFVTHRDAQADLPRIAKLFQVKEVDAVIPIGGADGTQEAGLAAAISGKLVWPVGSFGGAGKQVHELLSRTRSAWPRLPPEEVFGLWWGSWSEHAQDLLLQQLGAGQRLLIIHGRSNDRFKLKEYLQNGLNLPEPVLMIDRFAPGKTLPEKWELVTAGVEGAIALVTPDDVGGLAETSPVEPMERRARQNVWLEVGWVWGRAGRSRVLLLVRNETVIPSDLHGMEMAAYNDHPKEAGETIRRFVDSLRN